MKTLICILLLCVPAYATNDVQVQKMTHKLTNSVGVLLELAMAVSGERDPETAANNPNWKATEKKEWEPYVDTAVKQIWKELPLEARLIAYIKAWEAANGSA